MHRAHYDGPVEDGVPLDDDSPSIHNFLDSLEQLKYFPLFSGYDSVKSLCVLSEADFVRIGVVNAKDRRSMLARLERDLGAPSPEQKATLTRSGSQASISVSASLLPKKKKGILKGRFPLKATERHKSQTTTPSPTPRPSVSSLSSFASTVSVSEVLQDPDELLKHQPWFHGRVNRRLAEHALRNDGDVLVRESISKPGQYVLTALWHGKPLHFVADTLSASAAQKYTSKGGTLTRRRGSASPRGNNADDDVPWYRFAGDAFPSMVELVNHHLSSKQPIADGDGPVAVYAVPRHVTRTVADQQQQSRSRSASVSSSASSSRRNSLRLEDMDAVMLFGDGRLRSLQQQAVGGRSASVDKLDKQSPGVDSVGALSLPASTTTSGASIGEQSPQTRQKVSFGSKIKARSPLRTRRRPPSAISESGLLAGHAGAFSGSSGSLHRAGSSESLLPNPELPDRDFLRSICAVVMQHSAVDLARHIARVDIQTAHVLLPKELSADGAYLPLVNGATVQLSGREMDAVRAHQEAWRPGGAPGIANLTLPQGAELAATLLARFTSLSRWAAIVVMSSGDVMHRCTAVRKLVETAQCLQSDGLADLFGFAALMRGLRSPEVRRLAATWAEFRAGDPKLAQVFDAQLCAVDRELRRGRATHRHVQPSVPPLEPLLQLVTSPMRVLAPDDVDPPTHSWWHGDDADDADDADAGIIALTDGLDAVLAHADQARELSVQSGAYSMAAASRLTGSVCNRALEEYFKRDFPSLLIAARPGMPVAEIVEVEQLIVNMLDALSEAAEPSSVIGRNTSC